MSSPCWKCFPTPLINTPNLAAEKALDYLSVPTNQAQKIVLSIPPLIFTIFTLSVVSVSVVSVTVSVVSVGARVQLWTSFLRRWVSCWGAPLLMSSCRPSQVPSEGKEKAENAVSQLQQWRKLVASKRSHQHGHMLKLKQTSLTQMYMRCWILLFRKRAQGNLSSPEGCCMHWALAAWLQVLWRFRLISL
jgi:hypothetical protein